ncbi:MAG: sporulation protein YqfD [Lachnospiraceae bacterium]|nr:sporulation protein YqfD [Lachnospiraceae bacterium]
MLSLLKFLGGYLLVELTGYAPERFLNLCSNHDILIWDLSKAEDGYRFRVSVRAFYSLKPYLTKTGTRIRIVERSGLPFWMHRYRKRKFFFAGAFLAVALLFFLSCFIWNVDIAGNSAVTDDMILAFLEEEACGSGQWKSRIDCEQLESDLRKEFPNIIWASVRISGTKMTIDIKENLIPNRQEEPAEVTYTASDLIADKSGVVDTIVTRSGTPLVKEGDTVEAGTVLVSGRIDISNDSGDVIGYQYCNADADIMLRTDYAYEDEIAIEHQVQSRTGAVQKRYSFALFGRHFDLSFGEIPYEHYEKTTQYRQFCFTDTFYLPIYWYTDTYAEYEIVSQKYTKEELRALSTEKLNIYLKHLEEKDIQILEKNVMIEADNKFCRTAGTITVLEKVQSRQATEQLEIPAEEEGTAENESQ